MDDGTRSNPKRKRLCVFIQTFMWRSWPAWSASRTSWLLQHCARMLQRPANIPEPGEAATPSTPQSIKVIMASYSATRAQTDNNRTVQLRHHNLGIIMKASQVALMYACRPYAQRLLKTRITCSARNKHVLLSRAAGVARMLDMNPLQERA